jgi:pimeloyl-ACP methyl ester carboxylesterase
VSVLFLHGVAGSARTYDWLRLDSVRIDFRGHGAAQRAPGTYRLDHYVEDAIAVLLDMGPAALVGHSLGGVVAWTVAQRRPDLVTRAFLEDPPLFMGEPAEHERNPAIPAFRQMRRVAGEWQAAGLSEEAAAAELAAQRFFDGRRFDELQTPEALAARGYALTHLDLEVLDYVIDGSLLAATDTVSPVDVPVFILAADDAMGAAFPSAHEARLARSHPAVSVVRLPGATHTIHDEIAFRDEYERRLRAFL